MKPRAPNRRFPCTARETHEIPPQPSLHGGRTFSCLLLLIGTLTGSSLTAATTYHHETHRINRLAQIQSCATCHKGEDR